MESPPMLHAKESPLNVQGIPLTAQGAQQLHDPFFQVFCSRPHWKQAREGHIMPSAPPSPVSSGPASTPFSTHEWDPYGPTVEIIIGQGYNTGRFAVSQSMLSFYSTYFSEMCRAHILQRNENTIRLPGDDPEIFNMVLYYLTNDQRRFFDYVSEPAYCITFERIIDLYSFGEAKAMSIIQNGAVNLFARKIRFCTEIPDRWGTQYLWEKTRSGSKLRKMLVEMIRAMYLGTQLYASRIWPYLVDAEGEDPEMLVNAMEAMKGYEINIRVSHMTWRRLQACEWHEHEEGVACEAAEEAILDRGRGEEDDWRGLERGGRGPHRGIARREDSPSYNFGL